MTLLRTRFDRPSLLVLGAVALSALLFARGPQPAAATPDASATVALADVAE